MKQARLNPTMLMSKYEDMLNALDLSSVAKARQIILQFIIIAHIKLYEFSNNIIFIITSFLCSSLIKTIHH